MDGEGGGSQPDADDIPPSDLVFRRIPHGYWDKKSLRPNPTNFKGVDWEGVSVEWSRHSDPEKCRSHTDRPLEPAGVVKLLVGAVRRIDQLKVKHRPEVERPEHSLILGENLGRDATRVKVELADLCEWAIPPPTK